MKGGIWAAAALFVAASSAIAQDSVRLRSGKVLSGVVTIDPFDVDGFTIQLWDTGGTAYVRWSQVAASERQRLWPQEEPDRGDFIDGVRVVTSNREVVGIVAGETDQVLRVKTAGGASPVAIPKQAILLRRSEKIREGDAYSPAERVARREKEATTPEQLIDLGRFACGLRLYARAREIFTRAAEGGDAHRGEASELARQCAALIREADAEAALAAVLSLQRETKYDAAIEAAERWLAQFADTNLCRRRGGLVKALRDERAEFQKNRAKVLAVRVPEVWRSVRNALWSKYADRKYTFREATSAVEKLDAEIVAEVTRRIGATTEEAARFWSIRDARPITAGMGSGTWIYLGGQSGGFDHDSGEKRDEHRYRLGRPLQTHEDWWSDADVSQRRRWLQALYAFTSSMVKRTAEEDRECPHCRAAGTLTATRLNRTVEVVCPRCHRTKKEQSVTFW
jgi:tetratricopeptide (TPR) repeat protein